MRISTFLLLLLMPALYAAQTPENQRGDSTRALPEILITYQADRLTPVAFQNLSAKDLEKRSFGQEPSFILAETPSVTNYSDAGSGQGYSYIRIRGIDQTRINMTLDGVPLNEPEDQGAYFSNYPDLLNSVSKIQLQRGVGTTQNGVASYGGSLQLFSPNLYDSARTTFGLGYGSFNNWRAFGEFNSGVKNHKALYVRASQVYSDGYKYNSANNGQSAFVKGGLFYERHSWQVNLLVGQQQNELAWLGVSDSLIKIDPRTNGNLDEDDRFLQALASVQHQWQISEKASWQSTLYYTYLQGNYDFNLNNFLGLPSTEELYNYAFQSNLVGFFSTFILQQKAVDFRAGIHGNLYARQHLGSERNLGELYVNTGFKQEVSAFAKVRYQVGSVHLFGDLQYRQALFTYEGSVPLERFTWGFLNPRLGLSADLKRNWVGYYSLGRTGREPTRNDLFGGNDDVLAGPDGQALLFVEAAESVVDHEAGLRFRSSRWESNLNVFYMQFQNEIVLNGAFGPNGLALTQNVERSIRTGVEVSARYRINRHFSLLHHSSYIHARINSQNTSFAPILTPPLIINQEINYQRKKLQAALVGRYQAASYIDFANSATVEDFFLLQARLGYAVGKFQFSLFVNNLTNAQYFTQGYIDFDGSRKRFVQAPIHFFAGVEYRL